MKQVFPTTLIILFLVLKTSGQDKIYLSRNDGSKTKEAIVILPGFADSKKARKTQINFFKGNGYDVYIPAYSNRKSVQNCIQNFADFYSIHVLNEYDSLHFFAYILGTWVLNSYILEYNPDNITTIVYDRSPIQERAPRVATKKMPVLSKMVLGKVVGELSKIPYPTIQQNEIKIGLLIESKATSLMRKFEKTTLSMGELYWSPDSLNQAYDDFTYTRLNHDEMYLRFDVVGDDILHFIQNGYFSHDARRDQYNWDPFEKYKEK